SVAPRTDSVVGQTIGFSRPEKMPSFLAPMVRDSGQRYAVRNLRTGRIVADSLLTAFDSGSRRRGLLGRSSLAPGTGMIMAASNAVHTFFMRFPIDVVFVSKHGRVLKVRSGVPARRIVVSLRAYAVLEMSAGALQSSDTQAGDTLALAVIPQA